MQILAERCPNLHFLETCQRDDGAAYRSLAACRHFRNLDTIVCSPLQVTSAGVAVLAGLPLRRLGLLGGSVSDETLTLLLPLREQLTHFTLHAGFGASNSPPPSAICLTLAKFTKLEVIELYGGQGSPTDADLLLLAQLPQLKKLVLSFPEKSPDPAFPDARRLYSPAGLEAFHKARPDVELDADGKDYPATK